MTAWSKLQWGVTPWVHWAVVHNAYFCIEVWQLVCLPQYSYGIQEPVFQKVSQNFDGWSVPSVATHHASWNQTRGAHRRVEHRFAIV